MLINNITFTMKALHEDTSSMYLCSTASRKRTSENPLVFASFTTWKTYIKEDIKML
jgi:hypothetical protein